MFVKPCQKSLESILSAIIYKAQSNRATKIGVLALLILLNIAGQTSPLPGRQVKPTKTECNPLTQTPEATKCTVTQETRICLDRDFERPTNFLDGLTRLEKLDVRSKKEDALTSCSIIESMIERNPKEAVSLRFLLYSGAATAGSLGAHHNEFKKADLLFRKVEQKAVKYLEKATESNDAEKTHLALAVFYNTWGAEALYYGDFATASKKINLALKETKPNECSTKCAEIRETRIESLQTLATLQSTRGEYAQSTRTLKQVSQAYKGERLKSRHLDPIIQIKIAKSLIDEGYALLDTGDLANARKAAEKALNISHNQPDLLKEVAELEAALAYRMGNKLTEEKTEYSWLNEAAYSLARGDKKRALESFQSAVREILGNFEGLRSRINDTNAANNYKESLLSLYEAVYSLAQKSQDKMVKEAASTLSLNTHGLLLDIENEQANFRYSSKTTLPSETILHSLAGTNMVLPRQIAKSINTGEVLVEFRHFREWEVRKDRAVRPLDKYAYIGIALDSEGETSTFGVGDADKIDRMIKNLGKATADNLLDAENRISQVGDYIFKNAKAKLSKYTRIFVSADGGINLFPFSAYALTKSSSTMSMIVSGRDLPKIKSSTEKVNQKKSVVISSPEFGENSGQDRDQNGSNVRDKVASKWDSLPHTKQEGEMVSAILNADHFYGVSANERTLKGVDSPLVLHIATHGYFSGKQSTLNTPLSAVVLADANHAKPLLKEFNDGYLTSAEAAILNLKGTELVVLSACSTGQGEILAGEGVYGLQRSLAVAGARSTLLSLWKVDDAATAEFMKRFYNRLKAGEARIDALTTTQKEFRDGQVRDPQSKLVWSSPYYWAAWQLVGDWRPIKGL